MSEEGYMTLAIWKPETEMKMTFPNGVQIDCDSVESLEKIVDQSYQKGFEAGKKAAMQWLPIEQAPKDGTKVLVCDANGFVWFSEWGHQYGGSITWKLKDWCLDPVFYLPLPCPLEDKS